MEIQIIMAMLLVEELLKLLDGDRVALFVLSIVLLVLHLQAVVCQVDVLILQISRVIFITRRPNVPNIAKEEVLVVQGHGPHADVELPAPVQEWPLQVLLYNPVCIVLSGANEPCDLVQPIKYLNPIALIIIGRLHNPHVLLTMLRRQLFSVSLAVAVIEVVESPHELLVLLSIQL